MSIRNKAAFAAIGIACSLLTVPSIAGPSANIETPTVKIGVGSKNGFFFLPTMVAEGLGYYKDEGLKVDIIDAGSGGKALEALVAGSVDMISGAYDHVVQLRAKQVALQGFVLQARLCDYAVGLNKENAAKYKSPADLKGLKLGISSPGSGSDMFLKLFLAKHGIKASDVPTVSVGLGPTAVAAIRSGQIDGIANNDPVLGILEQAGDIKIIADGRHDAGSKDVYGDAYPCAAMIASESFIKKNPNTTQAVANAMVRTLKWMAKATPDEIIAAMPKQFSQPDPEVTKKILVNLKDTYSVDGLFPNNSADLAYNALQPYVSNLEAAKPQLSETFTNRFVKAVEPKSN
jgi:NitT/TauT family transport system substrate-binding protein